MSVSEHVDDSYTLSPIEEFEGLYGNIYNYPIEDIYYRVKKLMQWPNKEIVYLLESLRNELEDALLDEDDYFVITSIRKKLVHIEDHITIVNKE